MIAAGGVSIIIPVIRPEKYVRCVEAIEQNTPDDGFLRALTVGRRVWQYEIIADEDKDRIGCPKMVERLVESARGQLICFLGDDTIVQPGWLSEALKAMATLPDGWGLVGLNDGYFRDDGPATHWLADKRLLPLLGGEFFHTGYVHCFSDNELTDRCREMGRYVWAENARIIHDHPYLTGGPVEGTDYERAYRPDNWFHDKRLFQQRQRNGWKDV